MEELKAKKDERESDGEQKAENPIEEERRQKGTKPKKLETKKERRMGRECKGRASEVIVGQSGGWDGKRKEKRQKWNVKEELEDDEEKEEEENEEAEKI